MDSIPAQLNQTDYYLQAEKDRSHMLLLGRIFFFFFEKQTKMCCLWIFIVFALLKNELSLIINYVNYVYLLPN